MPELRYVDALTKAHHEEMARDERVVVLGEDVGRKGGVFGVTMGLYEKFGEERVIDSPLAESSIAGVAIGMAANGLLPIAGFQVGGFIPPEVYAHVPGMKVVTPSAPSNPIMVARSEDPPAETNGKGSPVTGKILVRGEVPE